MVRIGGSTDTGRHIKEHDYYTPTGEFRVDREGSPVLLNCLMYKMCYYRFGQVYTEASKCLLCVLSFFLSLLKKLFTILDQLDFSAINVVTPTLTSFLSPISCD